MIALGAILAFMAILPAFFILHQRFVALRANLARTDARTATFGTGMVVYDRAAQNAYEARAVRFTVVEPAKLEDWS